MEDSGSDTGDANLEDDHAEGSGGDTVQEAAHDSDDVQPAAWKVAGDVEVLYMDRMTRQDQARMMLQTRMWKPQVA